jgi:hypothetical protein
LPGNSSRAYVFWPYRRPAPGATIDPMERAVDGLVAMTVVCAWCRRTLATGGPAISHGICAGCRDRFLAELEEAVFTAEGRRSGASSPA